MASLEGKGAVVTGSVSGIGLGMAEALARAGASVMLNGFEDPAPALARVRAAVPDGSSAKVDFRNADVSDPEAVGALVTAAAETFGGLNILVNNAGIQHTSPIEDFAVERWDKVIAVNLSAAFYASQVALPLMRQTGWGRIINTASAHGLVASVNKAAYVAAKHGIMGLTKVTALETAEEDITCNAINPGWVRTELVERQIEALAERDGVDIDEAARRLLSAKQPSLRFVTPEQLGEALVFLCSNAASQITGIALPVDGGWTSQ